MAFVCWFKMRFNGPHQQTFGHDNLSPRVKELDKMGCYILIVRISTVSGLYLCAQACVQRCICARACVAFASCTPRADINNRADGILGLNYVEILWRKVQVFSISV